MSDSYIREHNTKRREVKARQKQAASKGKIAKRQAFEKGFGYTDAPLANGREERLEYRRHQVRQVLQHHRSKTVLHVRLKAELEGLLFSVVPLPAEQREKVCHVEVSADLYKALFFHMQEMDRMGVLWVLQDKQRTELMAVHKDVPQSK